MKLSWGYKILLVYVIFIIGMGFLVFKASSQKFDLVTKDYYDQELKYQNIIDQSANTAKLSSPLVVERSVGGLTVNFPPEMKGKQKSIDFYLYFPADAKRDFRKLITIIDNGFTQPLPEAMRGRYELKLSWEVEGVKYYFEKKLFF